MAQKYPDVKFEGIDIEPNNIDIAKNMITEANVEVFCGDIFNLPDTLINKYSGVTFLQSLFMEVGGLRTPEIGHCSCSIIKKQ